MHDKFDLTLVEIEESSSRSIMTEHMSDQSANCAKKPLKMSGVLVLFHALLQ